MCAERCKHGSEGGVGFAHDGGLRTYPTEGQDWSHAQRRRREHGEVPPFDACGAEAIRRRREDRPKADAIISNLDLHTASLFSPFPVVSQWEYLE